MIAILLFLIPAGKMTAQDVEFSASAPKVVSTGEQFRLIYTLNQQADQFIPPDLSGFQVLMENRNRFSRLDRL